MGKMQSAPLVEILSVTKRFGETARSAPFTAVDAVSININAGEFFSLLGPSGCGKTTLLRILAGFETPDDGEIRIAGQEMTDCPPHRRPVNMVFQQYALFPHLSVDQNVAFGLRYHGVRGSEARSRVDEALQRVRLTGLGSRKPSQLSGGQRQRVALARALVLQPTVLLLDEPLGALDQKLRREMQVELKHLQRELGITFIFVTHDQEEALAMSDRIAVMNAGRVEQVGPSAEVFERPATEFVARFMGATNFFHETIDGIEHRFVVRPEKLRLLPHGSAPEGVRCIDVTIKDRIYQGLSTLWTVGDSAGHTYSVFEQNATPYSVDAGLTEGHSALLCWNPEHAVELIEGKNHHGDTEARRRA